MLFSSEHLLKSMLLHKCKYSMLLHLLGRSGKASVPGFVLSGLVVFHVLATHME